jgi:hypothetical protein
MQTFILFYLIVQGIALFATAFIIFAMISSLLGAEFKIMFDNEAKGEIIGMVKASAQNVESSFSFNELPDSSYGWDQQKGAGHLLVVQYVDQQGNLIQARSTTISYGKHAIGESVTVHYPSNAPYNVYTDPYEEVSLNWSMYRLPFYIAGGLAVLMPLIQLVTRGFVQFAL